LKKIISIFIKIFDIYEKTFKFYELSSLHKQILLHIYLVLIYQPCPKHIKEAELSSIYNTYELKYKKFTDNSDIYELVDKGFLNFVLNDEKKINFFSDPFLINFIKKNIIEIIIKTKENKNKNNTHIGESENENKNNTHIGESENENKNNVFIDESENLLNKDDRMFNFNYLLKHLIESYFKEQNPSNRRIILERIESFLLLTLSECFNKNNLSYKYFPLFKDISNDLKKKYNIDLNDYYLDIDYVNKTNLNSSILKKLIEMKIIISPDDTNNGGPDKIFILTHKIDQTKNILILIQDKDEFSSKDTPDAVQSV
jgi:hypothetical protein